MTVVAALEFAQQLFTVRLIMAALTGRNHTMLLSMTEDTQEFGVLGRSRLQSGFDVFMAGAAIGVFNLPSECQGQRLMRLVTGHTVFEFLSFGMRLMTVQTIRLIAMLLMTEGAGKS